MHAEVRWSTASRAGFALFVPIFAAVCAYALAWHDHVVAALCAIAAVAAALLQIPLAAYRLRTDDRGFTVRRLLRHRRYDWPEVRKVELIGQARDGGRIVRWGATPADAFHVVLHTELGRVSVHRGMSGVDELLNVLARAGVLDRDDPSVSPAFRPKWSAMLNRMQDALELAQLSMVFPLSWLLGLMGVAWSGLALTGNLFVDGTLLALVPWVLGFLAYKGIERIRVARFGPELARPADAVGTLTHQGRLPRTGLDK